ncbi:MAG: hypothetical protein J0L87_02350 [Bacteroidetes bacterium]|nr:hypothetical protein [Bacteroidota bacterium]
MLKFSERTSLYILLVLASVFFVILILTAESTYDPGDGIRHYLVSRYSWKHPDLFLYSWGKPFFTLISSPFSQFGLLGINIFNIVCAVLSGYYIFKIAKILKLATPLVAPILLFFTPIYLPTINSGLTEPLFGLILISSIYLYFVNRYILGSLIISFLPFVRTEGFLIVPLFGVILLYRKKFASILFLASGTILYSIIGMIVLNDFFWIFNQNPYNGDNKEFYKQGELLHFINAYIFIWGTIMTFFLCIGIIFALIRRKININNFKEYYLEEVILILGSFSIYFIAHSIMWWKGYANSLGLIRVLAGIIPCTALICHRGIDLFINIIPVKQKLLKKIFLAIIIISVIASPFFQNYFPFKLEAEQKVIKETGDWFKKSGLSNKKVYYLYPLFAHYLNVDPYDTEKVAELWGLYPWIEKYGINSIPDSSVIIWDAHFGPNECQIPLERLMNDSNFICVKSFIPDVPFKTLNDYPFEVNAFIKLPKARSNKLLEKQLFNFEEEPPYNKTITIDETVKLSGSRSCHITAETEYSFNLLEKIDSVPLRTNTIIITSNVFVINENKINPQLVVSIYNQKGENIYWNSEKIEQKNTNNWVQLKHKFSINSSHINSNNIVEIYFWNICKNDFYIDDIEVRLLGK